MADETKDSKVTLSWNESIDKFGVTPDMVEEALKRGVRDHLLDNPAFVDQIRQAIRIAEEKISTEDLALTLKDDMLEILKAKIAAQRSELVQCLRDYTAFRGQYASDYIHRRYNELSQKLAELDKS